MSNTPGVVDESAGQHAMFLILSCLRNVSTLSNALHAGEWRGNAELGTLPAGKTLGIVGLGGIGRVLARLAIAHGMQIQYCNRQELPDNPFGARYVSQQELLSTSDVISIHVPLNASTQRMIGASEIRRMKEGSVLINTSRGKVLDEAALVDALDRGHLGSVGLDVFEGEPCIHAGLEKHESSVLTPHIATFTHEARYAVELLTLENAKMAILDGLLKTPVAEMPTRSLHS